MEQVSNSNPPPFVIWVRGVIHGQQLDLGNPNCLDAFLLCSKPSQIALQYIIMEAYDNHFRVDDPKNMFLQTYDSGIALMFEQQTIDARKVFVQYVGFLKAILKLDYGPTQTPIVIFKCEWLKREDN